MARPLIEFPNMAGATIEENAVNSLREKIVDLIGFDEKFGHDFYLFLWLKGHKLDPSKAEKAIRKSVEWRQTNNLNSNDDWPPGFIASYNLHLCGTKDDMPAIYANVTNMDLKKGMKEFGSKVWLHAWHKHLMRIEQIIFDFNKDRQTKLGKFTPDDVKLLTGFFNVKDFSMAQLTSMDMIKFSVDMCKSFVSYFPPVLNKIIYINMNKVFKVIFAATSPLLSTSMVLESYGTEENEWRNVLLNYLDTAELNRILEL